MPWSLAAECKIVTTVPALSLDVSQKLKLGVLRGCHLKHLISMVLDGGTHGNADSDASAK
jgi:hypothetical protein